MLSAQNPAYDPPAGYYSGATGSGQILKDQLHAIISSGHNPLPYTSSQTDTWDALKELNRDPAAPSDVLLLYSAVSVPADDTNGNGNPNITADSWSREHVWPRSYGIESSGPDNSDLVNLRPIRTSVNSSRGNRLFDEVDPNDSVEPGIAPPNCPDCLYDYAFGQGGLWEPRGVEKGDLARSMFYMVVRYDGQESGTTDLELGNHPDSESSLFGFLDTLVAWHEQDPVDEEERRRNHLVYGYQGNRNPFIDHPEFVSSIFGTSAPFLGIDLPVTTVTEGDGPITATITASVAPVSDLTITITKSGDVDEAGVAASVILPATQTSIPITITPSDDGDIDGSRSVTLKVSAPGYVFASDSLTVLDNDAPAGSSDDVWINEFHYDDAGTDANEFIEVVVGPGYAGNLSDIEIVLYNGNASPPSPYNTLNASTADAGDNVGGYQFYSWTLPTNGIQNAGSTSTTGPEPDGMALVINGVVQDFISYEGSFTAGTGVASGLTSVDIGVREIGSTADGSSIELGGTGSEFSDFTWEQVSDGTHTKGQLNTNQVLQSANTPPVFTSAATGHLAIEGQFFSLSVTGSDDDTDLLTLAAPFLPSWLTFLDNGNGTATLSGTASSGDADVVESILIELSDGTATATQVLEVEVRSQRTVYLLDFGVPMDFLDPTDNTDGDSYTQQEEFAFGMNPLVDDAPLALMEPLGSAVYPRITFPRRKNAGFPIGAESNTDLSDGPGWSSVGTRMVGDPSDSIDPDYEWVTYESITPIADADRQFLRPYAGERTE